MKKTILITTLVTVSIFGTTFISCVKGKEKKVENAQEKPSLPVTKRIYQTTTSTQLTPEVIKLGVTEIQVESQESTEYRFKIVANAMSKFNEFDNYNLHNRTVRVTADEDNIYLTFDDGNQIAYNDNANTYSFIDGANVLDMNDPSFDERFANEVNNEVAAEFGWGMYIFAQIRDQYAIREDLSSTAQRSNPVYVAVHFGKSAGMLKVKRVIDGYIKDNPGCKVIGGIDVSCWWDEHWCFFTVEFDCP
jgi:hypothetical protein